MLTTSAGTPVQDGSYDLTFKLFDVQNNGTELWSETQSGILVQRGTFSVILSSFNLPFDKTYYVEVTAEAGPGISDPVNFSPRTELVSAPYTMRAITADTADYAKATPPFRMKIEVNTRTATTGVQDGVAVIPFTSQFTAPPLVFPIAVLRYVHMGYLKGSTLYAKVLRVTIGDYKIEVRQFSDGPLMKDVEVDVNYIAIQFD